MRKTYFLLILFALTITASRVKAGWPIGKYRNIIVPGLGYYYATDNFDKDGHKVKAEPGNYFRSLSFNLYAGYGISRRTDFLVSLPVVYQTSMYTNSFGSGNSKGYGAGDVQAGLSYNLVNMGYEKFLSVVVSGIAPLYNKSSTTGNIGYGEFGTDVKFTFSGNIPKRIIGGTYFNVEVGGRRYFGSDGPYQFSAYGLLGFSLSKRNQVTVDAVYMRSISSNKQFSTNVTNIKDFELVKPSVNFGHTFTRRFSLFVGGFYTVYGRNTAVGYGGSISTILKI